MPIRYGKKPKNKDFLGVSLAVDLKESKNLKGARRSILWRAIYEIVSIFSDKPKSESESIIKESQYGHLYCPGEGALNFFEQIEQLKSIKSNMNYEKVKCKKKFFSR